MAVSDGEGGFHSARDVELDDDDGADSDGQGASSDDNSDSEAFLSARADHSDWYNEMRRRGSVPESPAHTSRSARSAASQQYWTPRTLDEGEELPEFEAKNTFVPNLMPKEFEKIFSKTRNGRYKEVEALLDKGAPIDGQDPYGNTVLHTACQNGNKRIVKACLRRSCDTNCQNIKGHTPLHFCFAFGYEEVGHYLVQKGAADPTIRNNFGLTAAEGIGPKKK
mmetsp:Transcript_21253/g.52315  ORF Transcript_21253/g.52315 Transcript_21253/m.52315 type:complete len:223 (+) Transcript_21253:178-846(+)